MPRETKCFVYFTMLYLYIFIYGLWPEIECHYFIIIIIKWETTKQPSPITHLSSSHDNVSEDLRPFADWQPSCDSVTRMAGLLGLSLCARRLPSECFVEDTGEDG